MTRKAARNLGGTSAKDGGAHAHIGAAHPDGSLVVAAHAHAEHKRLFLQPELLCYIRAASRGSWIMRMHARGRRQGEQARAGRVRRQVSRGDFDEKRRNQLGEMRQRVAVGWGVETGQVSRSMARDLGLPAFLQKIVATSSQWSGKELHSSRRVPCEWPRIPR